MTAFGGEEVIPMPAISMQAIENLGEALLDELCPEALEAPTPIPLDRWIDYDLPKRSIFISPAQDNDLPGAEGLTDPESEDGVSIEITIRRSDWESLFAGGRRAHRPRATVAHEIAHAIMHVPTIRRRTKLKHGSFLLQRVARGKLVAYCDPEWQAWALAGCILAPRVGIIHLQAELGRDALPRDLGRAFQISEGFAEAHMRRLRMI